MTTVTFVDDNWQHVSVLIDGKDGDDDDYDYKSMWVAHNCTLGCQ